MSKRMRGRNNNNRRSSHGLHRNYESNGPDVKVRGHAQHIAEKYLQLARDAQSSGDRVMAENYLQHAEHYFRVLAAAYEAMGYQQPIQRSDMQTDDYEESDESGEDIDPSNPHAPQPDLAGGMMASDEMPRQQRHQGERQHHNGHHGQRQHRDRFDRGQPRHDGEGQGADRGGHDRRRFVQAPVGAQEGDDAAADEAPRFTRPPREPRERREPRPVERAVVEDDLPQALPTFLTRPVRLQPDVAEPDVVADADKADDAAPVVPVRARRGRTDRLASRLGVSATEPSEDTGS